jgi:hypothetical protein
MEGCLPSNLPTRTVHRVKAKDQKTNGVITDSSETDQHWATKLDSECGHEHGEL